MPFKLFGKPASPEERLVQLAKKQDWAGLSRAYYELGREAMDRGDPEHAQLWLNRADTIYSADDAVYDKVGEKLIDDCSDRIGALEDEDILYNAVPSAVEEKAEKLGDLQVRLWGLLSMARLAELGKRLSALPGCQVLGGLDWAVDMMFRSLQGPPTQEDFQRLMDVCNGLYAFGDTPALYGGGEIAVPGGAPFQVFDLNGMGALLELNGYMDNHLRWLSAMSQDKETPAADTGIIAATLLPDYCVRTGAGRLEEVPRIKAELSRIWSDYDFLCSGPTWKQVEERIAAYKKLDLLA